MNTHTIKEELRDYILDNINQYDFSCNVAQGCNLFLQLIESQLNNIMLTTVMLQRSILIFS